MLKGGDRMDEYEDTVPILWAVASGGSAPPTYFTFARSEVEAKRKAGVWGAGKRFQRVTEGDACRWGLVGYQGRQESPAPIMACMVFACGDSKGILLA